MEITQADKKDAKPQDPVVEEMFAVGLHFGHKTSKTHPKMKQYIGSIRNTVHIFDLEKTKQKMEETLEVLSNMVKEGKVVLLVGTKVQVKEPVKEAATSLNLPYVSERWVAGTFTNFETISKRVAELIDLEKKKVSGELAKYTKKEQGQMENLMKDLEVKYGGLRSLAKIPDAVFVFDADENELTIREAKRKNVKVFAICDTNVDPTSVDYLIPANDDAASSVQYIVKRVKETIQNAQSQGIQQAVQPTTNGNN